MHDHPHSALHSTRVRIGLAVLVGLPTLIVALSVLNRIENDPDLVVLRAQHGTEWMRFPEEMSLRIRPLGDYQTSFRSEFILFEFPVKATLHFKALREAKVYLNDLLLLDTRSDPLTWKDDRTLPILEHLQSGNNTLRVEVFNRNGPRALIAWSDALPVETIQVWDASLDGEEWKRATLAKQTDPTELSSQFPSAFDALTSRPIFWVSLLLVVSLAVALLSRKSVTVLSRIKPSHVRWLLMIAWAILAVNNIRKIDPIIGFDIEGHINYIHTVATEKRLPLANEGWQAFQSPLYYIVSAPLYLFLTSRFPLDEVIQWLRIIPLLCGLIQIEIAYRCLRLSFPNRNDLQMMGTLIAAFLPINIYISQMIGNEPLAGVFTALTIYILLRLYHRPRDSSGVAMCLLLGVALGLAILSKITALLMLGPVVFAFLILALRDGSLRWKHWLVSASVTLLTTMVIAGWYFIRNWRELGKPIVGGWDPSREIVWWQDPGYRTLDQFASFGEALVRPVLAGTHGMWDAFYASFWMDSILSGMVEFDYQPPWNYDLAIVGVWTGLLLTAAMIVGVVMLMRRPWSALETGNFIAPLCIAIYVAAFGYLYLTLPIYSTGKATYTVGLTPCYAILAAIGLERMLKIRYATPVLYAGVACWAVGTYAAYFVL